MGRRKIEIQPLTDDRNRTVTFVKRKAGLFKKAHELAVLCQVDLAVIIIGNNNKVYEFSSLDTAELINFYQQNKIRLQESKSPENYGNYKKKRKLSDTLQKKDAPGGELQEDDEDSDYSDSPEPSLKRPKKANMLPTFNQPYSKTESGPAHKRDDSGSHRPILRVQIPGGDSKENELGPKSVPRDSACTITAVEGTSAQPTEASTAVREEKKHYIPALNAKTGNSTMENRRPTLPIPIGQKSQTSLPALATAPQLPGGMFVMQSPQGNTGNYPSGLLPTPVLNQVFNQYNGNSSTDGSKRPLIYPNMAYTGEQTPMSGLPSRYVNDMFPSPLTFYAPQDWNDQRVQNLLGPAPPQVQGTSLQTPNQTQNQAGQPLNQQNLLHQAQMQMQLTQMQPNIPNQQNQQNLGQSASNMTPVQGIPLYFMGMLPTGITPTTSASTAGLGQMQGASNNNTGGKGSRELPLPLHFMSAGSFNKK